MRCFGNLSVILILAIYVDKAFLQPEKVQWEFDDAVANAGRKFSAPESTLQKMLPASHPVHKRKNQLSLSFKDPRGKSMSHLEKKGLGMFTQGRPSLPYKSLFRPWNSQSFSGLGSTRFSFDRPRPLRWG